MSNRIRIIATSDIHGKVFPYNYSDGSAREWGMLKLAGFIEELRDENSILIDNGDILQGSPLQYFHFSRSMAGPSPVTRAMKEMKYDYINIGNHDFDYGPERLDEHIIGSGALPININMGYAYDIREIAGKKIAIFGVLTHHTERWQPRDKIEGVDLRDAFTMAKETVERIRKNDNPDYIICCYHGGLEWDMPSEENQGIRMMKEIEGLDILIAGHQHSVTAGSLNGTHYTQAGMDGSHISVVDIDTESGEIAARVLALDEKKPMPDERIGSMLKYEEEECQAFLDTAIGRSGMDLRIHDEKEERINKSQLITFINEVQMERMGGDISAACLFEGATGLGEDITMRQLLTSYPFPNSLVLKSISGRVLKEYLEKNAEFWDVSGDEIVVADEYMEPIHQFFNYDILDGVEYIIDAGREKGDRIVSLKRNGRPVSPEDEFTIALNSYRASGGGGFDMIGELPTIKNDFTDMVEILADYIIKNGEINFDPVYNVKVTVSK